jgi:hypothetical protein
MNVKMNGEKARTYMDRIYRQVAERWQRRVSSSQFMKALAAGKLSKETFRLFLRTGPRTPLRSIPWKRLLIISTSTSFVNIAI